MRQLIGLLFGVLLGVALCGCRSIRTVQQPTTPFAHRLVREQLVLHSDFPLPERHRLIDELAAQRELLSEKLHLAATDEPIHVFLFADDANYYDFLARRFPGFPSRRAIFVETDVQLAVYAHWGDHVAEDLRHEVCHGYLHAAVPHLPLWLDEGLAEYFEVGRGQHGVNRPHVELLHQQHAAGQWQPDLARLEGLTSAADMTQQDYAEAWAWVHFLLESGDDKSQLLTDYLANLQQGVSDRSLSARLAKRLASPELALVEHLESLR